MCRDVIFDAGQVFFLVIIDEAFKGHVKDVSLTCKADFSRQARNKAGLRDTRNRERYSTLVGRSRCLIRKDRLKV